MPESWKNWFKTLFKAVLFGVGLALFIELFGAWGFYGFIIIILTFAGFRLYKMRHNFVEALRYIENMVWKKPLDKTYWDKGELKNTKVKIVWRKKDEQ